MIKEMLKQILKNIMLNHGIIENPKDASFDVWVVKPNNGLSKLVFSDISENMHKYVIDLSTWLKAGDMREEVHLLINIYKEDDLINIKDKINKQVKFLIELINK